MSAPVLVLEAVSKGYRRGDRWRPVLRRVSLEVEAGQIVAVAGDRNEGKTTLLHVAAGLEMPDEGVVRFDGVDSTTLRAKDRESLRGRAIGWSDRRGPRHPWRVLDYVGLALAIKGQAAAEKRALEALDRVGALWCATQHWEALADWEQVLVGLARLYAQRPRLMIIDDLLEGLHIRGTQQAGDLLSGLVEEIGCGVLMSVSHTEAALVADRVMAFERGTLNIKSDLAVSPDQHAGAVIDLTRKFGQKGG